MFHFNVYLCLRNNKSKSVGIHFYKSLCNTIWLFYMISPPYRLSAIIVWEPKSPTPQKALLL